MADDLPYQMRMMMQHQVIDEPVASKEEFKRMVTLTTKFQMAMYKATAAKSEALTRVIEAMQVCQSEVYPQIRSMLLLYSQGIRRMPQSQCLLPIKRSL